MRASRVPVDQVEQWKQVDPDNVDEMPVEAADLDWSVILGTESAFPRHDQKPEKDAQPDDHMQRVQPSHDEVKREKQLRMLRVGVLPGMARDRHFVEAEGRAGNVMLFELVLVLD